MAINKQKTRKSFFRDDNRRIVLWQNPNIPLYGWIIFKSLSVVLAGGQLKNGSGQLSRALLFTWAFLELTNGINYFRRSLGLIILIAIISGFFTK